MMDRTAVAGQAFPDPRRWLALGVVLFAAFMDLLDTTIVNVAIPKIQQNLHAEYAQIEWVIAAYALAFAVLLITGGRLGDIFGRKRFFLIGMAGFTIASVLCGTATTPGILIASRFFQGAMAALMVPQILSIIHVTFAEEERGKVFGLFGAVAGTAAVAGPLLGGLLVQWNLLGLHWRPIFLVNVPVGIAGLITAWFVVRETRSSTASRLDLPGVALAVGAVLMLAYPLTEGRQMGWPAWTFLLMGGALPMLAIFAGYERRRTSRTGSPLVVLSLFRARGFCAGLLVWLMYMITIGGFFLMWTLYMQVGLGWTPLHAGLTAIPFSIGTSAAAGLSVQILAPRLGRKVLMLGAALTASGFGAYSWEAARYGGQIHSWQMILPLTVAGLGFGLVVAPVADIVLTEVPRQDAGSASGLFSTAQQLGSALGVAVIGVVFFALVSGGAISSAQTAMSSVRGQMAAAAVPPQAQEQVVHGFLACVHEQASAAEPGTPSGCRPLRTQISRLPAGTAAHLGGILGSADAATTAGDFSRSFSLGLRWVIGILVAVFFGMFALPRRAASTASPVIEGRMPADVGPGH